MHCNDLTYLNNAEEELTKHSIDKIFISKGVGKNLQDHHEVSVIAKTKPGYGYFGQDKGFKMLKNGLQYLLFKTLSLSP